MVGACLCHETYSLGIHLSPTTAPLELSSPIGQNASPTVALAVFTTLVPLGHFYWNSCKRDIYIGELRYCTWLRCKVTRQGPWAGGHYDVGKVTSWQIYEVATVTRYGKCYGIGTPYNDILTCPPPSMHFCRFLAFRRGPGGELRV